MSIGWCDRPVGGLSCLEGRCGSAERSEQSATSRAQLFTRRNCSLRLRTPRMRLRPCMAPWLLGVGSGLGSSSLLVAPRCSRLQLVVSEIRASA